MKNKILKNNKVDQKFLNKHIFYECTKKDHEEWVKTNLNKSYSLITTVEGEFVAKGKGKVTGIRTKKPTIIKAGTKATAEGEGVVTGLDIE